MLLQTLLPIPQLTHRLLVLVPVSVRNQCGCLTSLAAAVGCMTSLAAAAAGCMTSLAVLLQVLGDFSSKLKPGITSLKRRATMRLSNQRVISVRRTLIHHSMRELEIHTCAWICADHTLCFDVYDLCFDIYAPICVRRSHIGSQRRSCCVPGKDLFHSSCDLLRRQKARNSCQLRVRAHV